MPGHALEDCAQVRPRQAAMGFDNQEPAVDAVQAGYGGSEVFPVFHLWWYSDFGRILHLSFGRASDGAALFARFLALQFEPGNLQQFLAIGLGQQAVDFA